MEAYKRIGCPFDTYLFRCAQPKLLCYLTGVFQHLFDKVIFNFNKKQMILSLQKSVFSFRFELRV